MKFILIPLLLFCFNDAGESIYYHKEVICSFSYTTVKEYQLNLHESNKFDLLIQTSDTRRSKNVQEKLQGLFEKNGDTLNLQINGEGLRKYYTANLWYILEAGNLINLKRSIFFPDTLKMIRVPILTGLPSRVELAPVHVSVKQ